MDIERAAVRIVISPWLTVSRHEIGLAPTRSGVTAFSLAMAGLSTLLFFTSLCGCQRQDQISAYSVPKEEAPPNDAEPQNGIGEVEMAERTAAGSTAPSRRQRMLAAMVPEGATNAWFFKMTGDSDSVAAHVAAFKSLVRSLRFEDSQPQFQVPDQWRRQAGRGMRFATLTCGPVSDPIETSVIRLGVRSPNWETYVLENVNRWRGQLGLAPVTDTQLSDAVEILQAGDLQVTLLDIEGTATEERRQAPFARRPNVAKERTPSRPQSLKPSSPNPKSPEFTYDLPSHWKTGPAGGMRKAVFQLNQNDHQAEVTVITLGESGGEMLPNVNRWRDQVGLAPLRSDQLDAFVETFTVGGKEGWFARCLDEAQPEAIMAAVVVHDGKTWFFKMMGDRPLVNNESDNFETFLESIEFGDD